MMRLKVVEAGHNAVQKEQFEHFKAMTEEVPRPALVFSYRRDIFGKYFAACAHEAMRLSTAWETGETELFSAFVSKLNQCEY